ncbi:MAG TPA: helix-turn-helix transcriptional regulator [Solirubrobacteraceae bacterium]|nr:helix-turn-helix transcriptional regulator [Solirubrobacteraceae bacterium]
MGRFAYFSYMESGATDRRLGAVAAELSAISDLTEFRVGVLPILRGLIVADMASYNEISRSPPGALVTADPVGSLGLASAERQRRFAELVWQNPLAAHFGRTGDPSAQRMSDFISTTALHRLELYDEYYRELGTEHQLAFTVPADACLIGITLSRCGARDFAVEDRELLDQVRGLVIPLYHSLLDRDRLRAVLAAVEQAGAGAGPLAVLLVHASGALEAAHERAESLLAALVEDRAQLEELHDWTYLQRRQRVVTRRSEPLLLRLRAREMLALYVPGRPGALDAIALCPSPRPAIELLRGLGLTPRQARVLQLLWEGATNAEIALALTLSEHTVRHHVEEIYRRLGVRSRAGAANLAGRALRE